MTPDEAKLLRPGDYVLAMVRIQEILESSVFLTSEYVDFGDITERLRPMPRRKFRVGDIVLFGNELRFVINDQDRFGVTIASEEFAEYGGLVEAAELTLICPVDERHDMASAREDNAGEPAAAPAELQRGNLASKIGGAP